MLHAFYHPDRGLRLFTDPAQATAWVEASGQELAAVFALSPATPARAGPGGDWESALALLHGNYYRLPGPRRDEGALLILLAKAYRRRGDVERAVRLFNLAGAAHRDRGDLEGAARAFESALALRQALRSIPLGQGRAPMATPGATPERSPTGSEWTSGRATTRFGG